MAGMCESSYEERQEDEVEFLHAVFPGDFQDLRMNDSWKVGESDAIMMMLSSQGWQGWASMP